MIEIVVRPLGHSRFTALLGDRVLEQSTLQPFLDAARVLKDEGTDPNEIITMRHEGSAIISLRATIATAANLTVQELSAGGIKFRKWRSFEMGPS